MHQKLIQFNKAIRATRTDLPSLEAGDVVKIHRKIKESGKERTQMFQGMVIAVKGGQSSSPTITVRKVSSGVGVELVLPLYSPQIEKIDFVKRTKAGRGKLYYVRTKSAKVLGKKLKEVPFAVGKAATEVADAMKAAPVNEGEATLPVEEKPAEAVKEEKETE
ncbi:MAG: 50S ribosomal protein L19 [Candidatus Moraniibacteriota bacterium]